MRGGRTDRAGDRQMTKRGTSSVAALVMARAMQRFAADRGDPEMLRIPSSTTRYRRREIVGNRAMVTDRHRAASLSGQVQGLRWQGEDHGRRFIKADRATAGFAKTAISKDNSEHRQNASLQTLKALPLPP